MLRNTNTFSAGACLLCQWPRTTLRLTSSRKKFQPVCRWPVCWVCVHQGGRVVKALDLRSNVRMHTWVRTPFLVTSFFTQNSKKKNWPLKLKNLMVLSKVLQIRRSTCTPKRTLSSRFPTKIVWNKTKPARSACVSSLFVWVMRSF